MKTSHGIASKIQDLSKKKNIFFDQEFHEGFSLKMKRTIEFVCESYQGNGALGRQWVQ